MNENRGCLALYVLVAALVVAMLMQGPEAFFTSLQAGW